MTLAFTTAKEPILGWRVWRVLPFERLDGSRTVRLCAVGTLGIPKVWEPLRETVAVCSSYATDHEAPWPEHECGIWALKRPEVARKRMLDWMETQDGEPAGWAIGQVSLWGRVIEHEHGWRAQRAYPYAVSVESQDERVARAVRDEYAVDVTWTGGELVRNATAKRVLQRQKAETIAAMLSQVRSELEDSQRELASIKAELVLVRRSSSPPRWRSVPYGLSDEDWVAGVERALAESKDGTVTSRQVAYKLLDGPSHLPMREGEPIEVGQELSSLSLSGKVVRLRGPSGVLRWTLPGREVGERFAAWKRENPHDEYDERIWQAVEATVAATGKTTIRTRDVLPFLDAAGATISEKVRIAHGLRRLALRGRLRQLRTQPIESWAVA